MPSRAMARLTMRLTRACAVSRSASSLNRSSAWKLPVQKPCTRQRTRSTKRRGGRTVADVSDDGGHESRALDVFFGFVHELGEVRHGDTRQTHVRQTRHPKRRRKRWTDQTSVLHPRTGDPSAPLLSTSSPSARPL